LRADITQISAETGCEPEVVNKILQKLSLAPGALVGNNVEHFLMTNPVWEKPGLSFAGDFYFIVPMAIFSHIHLIMRSLIREAEILPALEKRRSKFLESELIETFKTVITDGAYHPNFTGKYKGTDFETDLVIKIDRVLVIAEAKSAALSIEALRGAKDRIKRHIDDLVVDPSEQSARIMTDQSSGLTASTSGYYPASPGDRLQSGLQSHEVPSPTFQ
jgi:hypothetical protein